MSTIATLSAMNITSYSSCLTPLLGVRHPLSTSFSTLFPGSGNLYSTLYIHEVNLLRSTCKFIASGLELSYEWNWRLTLWLNTSPHPLVPSQPCSLESSVDCFPPCPPSPAFHSSPAFQAQDFIFSVFSARLLWCGGKRRLFHRIASPVSPTLFLFLCKPGTWEGSSRGTGISLPVLYSSLKRGREEDKVDLLIINFKNKL